MGEKGNKWGYKPAISIKEQLFAISDEKFKNFHSRLIKTVKKERIIGVKIPATRALAKSLIGEIDVDEFMKNLPHEYYEEDNLHACFINETDDFILCTERLFRFLPYVDNWATCDLLCPKVLFDDKVKLLENIKVWLRSEHTYEVRFAIVLLLRGYLGKDFSHEHIKLINNVKNDDFYVKMASSWYYATALFENYDDVIGYFERGEIKDKFIFNKSISKAVESLRIDKNKKQYLKSLKIK